MLLAEKGFSILELIVAITVFAIVGSAAVGSFKDLSPSYLRSQASSQIVEDLRLAQATAVLEGCRIIFRIDSGANGYSIGCDYEAYDTTNPIESDVEFDSKTLPRNISISYDSTIPVIFNSRGQIIDEDGLLDTRTITASYDNGSGTSDDFFSARILATGVLDFN